MPSSQRAKLCLDIELPPEMLHHCLRCLTASDLARVEMSCPRLRAAAAHAVRELAARCGFGESEVEPQAGESWASVARFVKARAQLRP